jgi:hypothetical protein
VQRVLFLIFFERFNTPNSEPWAKIHIVGRVYELMEKLEDAAKKAKKLSPIGGGKVLNDRFKSVIEDFKTAKKLSVTKFKTDADAAVRTKLEFKIADAATKARGKAVNIVDSWARCKRYDTACSGDCDERNRRTGNVTGMVKVCRRRVCSEAFAV